MFFGFFSGRLLTPLLAQKKTDKRNAFQFLDRGANFDVDGKMKNWWTKESWKHFLEKQKCFVDYFSKYEIGGFKVQSHD